MASSTEALVAALAGAPGDALREVTVAFGEVTVVVAHDRVHDALIALRVLGDAPAQIGLGGLEL